MKFSVLLVALFTTLALGAQNKVYFVDDVTDAGEPVGHATEWGIPMGEEGTIYVLYTNNKKPIKEKSLNVKVELKNENGTYDPFEEYTVEPDAAKTWVMFEIPFIMEGEYKITIQTAAKKDLASENLTIVIAAPVEEVIDEITEAHAKGFKLQFCESIDDLGNPVNVKKEFKLVSGKAPVMINLSHKDDLKANRFTIKIVKNGDKANGEEVIDIEAGADWPAFTYEHEFTAAGVYTVSVHSPSGKVLNFEMVTIK